MMLARAASRRRSIAIRLAMGAGRARLIRQLLMESMLVALGAGVAGFLLAVWFLRMCSRVSFPFPMPVTYDFTPDLRVVGFTFLLTVLTGVGFGMVPAIQATRADLTTALKEGADVRLERYRRLSLRNILVAAQVAGSLSLLLVTGFLVIGFNRNNRMDAGFDPRNIYSIAMDPVREGYTQAQAAAFFDRLLDRVKALPGISSACLTDTPPMRMSGQGLIPVSSADDARITMNAAQFVVSRDYFEVLGVPILTGRPLREEDEAGATNAVIVSESVSRMLWNGDAIGRRIQIGGDVERARFNRVSGTDSFDRRAPASGSGKHVREVVGVVKDMRWGIGLEKPGPGIYFPMRAADYSHPSLNGVSLLVHGEQGSGDILGAVRREAAAIDEKVMPFHARTMEQQIDEVFSLYRLAAWVYGAVGMFGLVLACAGLAGVTAYSVTQRAHEIGIRMALGARHADVLQLVMKEGLVLVIAGAAIGLALARAATRVLSTFLSASQTTAHATTDPVLLIGAPLLLAFMALLACYVPARRSTRIDPVIALRQE
jgi:predicted permease